MGEKKDRGRFTIKFNEHDPAHESVIHILERQGPRQKAQFIANAILHYIHCSETPDLSMTLGQPVEKEAIRSIVLEILKQQGMEEAAKKELLTEKEQVRQDEKVWNHPLESGSQKKAVDDEVMALIASTMSAFRSD